MSKLTAFLKPTEVEEVREVVISKRFLEDGKPVPFKIKSITQEENSKLVRACTKQMRDRTGVTEQFDRDAYSRKLVLACVVEPDFKDAELCSAYHVVDPEDVPGRMLLSGEHGALLNAISDVNCIGSTDIYGEAKNS